MGVTSIEWCDMSANPIRARRSVGGSEKGHFCEKISTGCANCFASTLQKRFRMPAFPGQSPNAPALPANNATKTGAVPYLDEAVLAAIRKRRKPTRYFVCDMTDVFGWWVPDEWLDAMFATFARAPQHTFMLLTKRPERMRSYLTPSPEWDFGPLPNVWLGVSAEDQKRWDERVPILAQTPAAVRFVSVEPMLERIELHNWFGDCNKGPCSHTEGRITKLPYPQLPIAHPMIDWVIFGGESGRGARPCNVEWIRDGLAQCKAAGVSAFVKQLGARAIEPSEDTRSGVQPAGCIHAKGGDPAEWDDDLRVREFPQTP